MIHRGDRIAQIVVAPVSRASFELSTNCRRPFAAMGGFGSTGVLSLKVYIVGKARSERISGPAAAFGRR